MSLTGGFSTKARQAIARKYVLSSKMTVLRRTVKSDGGGTDIETFARRFTAGVAERQYACALVPIIRRPGDPLPGDEQIQMADIELAYECDCQLDQDDQVQIGARVYNVRLVYDNVVGASTYKAYIAVVPRSTGGG